MDSMQAVKLGRGHLYFIPRDLASRLQVFEDFIDLLEEHNQLRRPDRAPLAVNSIFVVDDTKQRSKMAAAFYQSVRKEIADCEEHVTHLIQSGSQSPKIMERWIMRIQGLQEKKRSYEDILKRELTELDDNFTSLRYLSDELRIRAAGLAYFQPWVIDPFDHFAERSQTSWLRSIIISHRLLIVRFSDSFISEL